MDPVSLEKQLKKDLRLSISLGVVFTASLVVFSFFEGPKRFLEDVGSKLLNNL